MDEAKENEITTPPISIPKKKIKKTTILLIILIFSLSLNILLFFKTDNYTGETFRLVKPAGGQETIDSNIQDDRVIIHYNGLKETIEQEIEMYSASGDVGIFLQDIKTGTWLGINERDGFSPVSLLKMPIMMAILKKVERKEINLNDKIEIIDSDLDDLYGVLYEKGSGAKISVSDLLKEMILASDNTAKNVLKRQLSMSELNAIFVHVGIPNPYLSTNEQKVSPRGYSRMFKSLYYSSFLSPELSERALDLTTDTQEESLISRGVPYEIQVAHKFGIQSDNGELHDCGIIYHPKNPYIFCIMTRELGLDGSADMIAKISKDIYEFVDNK